MMAYVEKLVSNIQQVTKQEIFKRSIKFTNLFYAVVFWIFSELSSYPCLPAGCQEGMQKP